ncbi:MAG: hypothetical protein WBG19_10445 [Thermoplasmata archaeon]
MAAPAPRTISSTGVGLSAGVLLVAIEAFALTTTLPWIVAIIVGGSGGATAILLRLFSGGRRTDSAALVVLLVLGVLAVTAPDSPVAGAAGGLVVLALLLWLADDPERLSGGMRRAIPAIGVAGLAFGVAWVSAFLLPSTRVPTGVIAGLLVAVILLATALLARPEILEEEPALVPTS